MVRIVIDHDVVTGPVPAVAIRQVIRSDAKIKAAKPKTVRAPSRQVPHMRGAKSAREMPMLPRMIQMVVRIIRSRVMSNPMAVVVDMRRVGMPRSIAEVPVRSRRRRRPVVRSGPCAGRGATCPPPPPPECWAHIDSEKITIAAHQPITLFIGSLIYPRPPASSMEILSELVGFTTRFTSESQV